MKLTVQFERVGRRHDVAPITVEGEDADEIAFHVYNYVRKMMLSRDVEVDVDLDKMDGRIYAGFNNGGSFTLTEVSG